MIHSKCTDTLTITVHIKNAEFMDDMLQRLAAGSRVSSCEM